MSSTAHTGNTDFQSPTRKRKVPMTSKKRYSTVSRKIAESPYKMFDPRAAGAMACDEDGCGHEADVSSQYISACESPDRSTVPRRYSAATDSEGNSTKVVHSPHLLFSNHLAASFPHSVADSPFQHAEFSQGGPRRAMETCQDSSLSTISHNNSAILGSPPRCLFDSNGTGEELDVAAAFADTPCGPRDGDREGFMLQSPAGDMHPHSFDDVQSPEVGTISMCASPMDGDGGPHAEMLSPSRCLIRLSPTIFRSTPSPRMAHQFSCVRHMSLGEEGHFSRSGTTSPLQFHAHVNANARSPVVANGGAYNTRRSAAKKPDGPLTGEAECWHGDSSGVAKGMSTLNVNKHHHDSCCMHDSGKHKCRRGLAGAAISGEAFESEVRDTGPSPIMSSHTSFMELLDAASESPTRPQPGQPAPARSQLADTGLVRPSFNMGAPDSPRRPRPSGHSHTPQRGAGTKETANRTLGHKKQQQNPFDSPVVAKDKSPGTLFAMGAPSSPAQSYSSPAVTRTAKRLELSPPGSFTSVASGMTSCTEDDDAPSPPRKTGSSRSILSDFALQRCNSNNSVLSGLSNNSSLPLPDQSAFDNSVMKQPRLTGSGRGAPSPVCPPTPDRSNLHWGSAYANNSIGSIEFEGSDGSGPADEADDEFIHGIGRHGTLSQSYPLLRQNSLDSNKILVEGEVSRDPTDQADVVFERDFENLGVLGAGSFAIVYFSKRKKVSAGSPDRHFAIKKNKKKFRGHGDRESLLNEVRMMKLAGTTSCPHIVHLIRAWQEEGFLFVQMDVAEKGSLRDLLLNMTESNAPLPDDTVWRLLHDTLLGLRHIHSYDVVHLDIKPANLLVSRGGRVMIGDFGLAAHSKDDKDANEGDARYMAPEMLSFTERSSASDMFSFGLTFYEICLVPSPRANLPVQGDLWLGLREGRVPSMHTEFATRPAALIDLLMACLVPAPEQRATAAELLVLPDLTRVGHICPRGNVARTASFTMMQQPQLEGRPVSFSRAFESVPPIDLNACEQKRQNATTPNADLCTPTHLDSTPYNSMFRFRPGVPR